MNEAKKMPEEIDETENIPLTAANDSIAPDVDSQVESLKAENAELKDKLLRALAEAENTRRRAQKEREDTIRYAIADFARSLLTVSDNFSRALEAVKPDQRTDNPALNSMMTGVSAVERELQQIFELSGMRKLEPLDQAFDPNFHEVMFEVENTGKPPGTIVQVLQSGYVLHDRLLRPARVAIAKGEVEERRVDQTI